MRWKPSGRTWISKAIIIIFQSITPGMTRIIQGTGVGVTHGAGDGLSEFRSDLADVGAAGSAVAFSVQASDTSALVTLASCIRGSDASALPMRVLVADPAAAAADSMIKPDRRNLPQRARC